MSFTKTSIFLVSLLVLSFYFAQATNYNDSWGESYDEYVVNDLNDYQNILRIHIFSGDDDLGYHDLKPYQGYHWKFRMKFPGITKFFGRFLWAGRDKGFTVFDSKISNDHCGETGICYWVVKPDGFYIANKMKPSPGDLVKKHGWET
ncbi:hypothetical protein ACH5RR_016187 [Cinchona calisaya]|uniref:S-protein homolog n=1 Tax=Cinchona calisaya TaxID=153742 RepID=A0ABD3A0S4_9GENT